MSDVKAAVDAAFELILNLHGLHIQAHTKLVENKLFRVSNIRSHEAVYQQLVLAAKAASDVGTVDAVHEHMKPIAKQILGNIQELVDVGFGYEGKLIDAFRPGYARVVARNMTNPFVPRDALSFEGLEILIGQAYIGWNEFLSLDDVGDIATVQLAFERAISGWNELAALEDRVRRILAETTRARLDRSTALDARTTVVLTAVILILTVIAILVTLYSEQIAAAIERISS